MKKYPQGKFYLVIVALSILVYSMLTFIQIPLICTYTIIGLNFIVYIFIYNGKLNVSKIGTSYKQTIEGKEYYRLVTSAFTHEEMWHILMNMYSLYNLGYVLENYFGSIKFFIYYIIIMLIGGVLSNCMHKQNTPYVLSIGASGVLCGLFGMYIVLVVTHLGLQGFYSCIPTLGCLCIMTFSKRIDSIGHFSGLLVGILLGLVGLMF